MRCDCELEASLSTATNDGLNKGRRFWSAPTCSGRCITNTAIEGDAQTTRKRDVASSSGTMHGMTVRRIIERFREAMIPPVVSPKETFSRVALTTYFVQNATITVNWVTGRARVPANRDRAGTEEVHLDPLFVTAGAAAAVLPVVSPF